MTTNTVHLTPLALETRTAITTAEAAQHLNRAQQTLRGWACTESGPIRPIRVNGRLAWPVAEIRRLLGVTYAASEALTQSSDARMSTRDKVAAQEVPHV